MRVDITIDKIVTIGNKRATTKATSKHFVDTKKELYRQTDGWTDKHLYVYLQIYDDHQDFCLTQWVNSERLQTNSEWLHQRYTYSLKRKNL